MYIHGAGFISGSCLTHRSHVAKFVQRSGIRAVLFDYRLAPEHPFPAAVEDCIAAYCWLLDQGCKPEDIAPQYSWSEWTQMYIADNDPNTPWLSPQKANLGGLPPMLLWFC